MRLFNTVGPRQTGRYGMVVPNLVGQALSGQPLTVFGDGRQTRCFSYVGDVVPAMVAIAEHPASRGQAFNLGGSFEVSILDLARRIIQVLGSDSPITLVPYDQAYGEGYEDMRRRVPDNTKAGELVGFDPTTTLDEIIVNVAEGRYVRAAAAPQLPAWPRRLPAAMTSTASASRSPPQHRAPTGPTSSPCRRVGTVADRARADRRNATRPVSATGRRDR